MEPGCDTRFKTSSYFDNGVYTSTVEGIRLMARFLMLPVDFDADIFSCEYEACCKWLIDLGALSRKDSVTDDSSSGSPSPQNSASIRAIRGARAFTGSSTPITRGTAYSNTRVTGGTSRQLPLRRRGQRTSEELSAQSSTAKDTPFSTHRNRPPLSSTRFLP